GGAAGVHQPGGPGEVVDGEEAADGEERGVGPARVGADRAGPGTVRAGAAGRAVAEVADQAAEERQREGGRVDAVRLQPAAELGVDVAAEPPDLCAAYLLHPRGPGAGGVAQQRVAAGVHRPEEAVPAHTVGGSRAVQPARLL